MKKILVPMDFSQLSLTALDYAVNISSKTNSQIYLLNVIPRPYIYSATPDLDPYSYAYVEYKRYSGEQKKNAESILNSIKNLQQYSKYHFITKVVVSDVIYSEILDFAETNKIDLIIMGSNGPKTLGKKIIGTNAERVLRFTSIPVLVIKNKNIKPLFQNIIFASNFNIDANKVFPTVKELSELYDSRIHLLYVNTKSDFLPTEKINEKILKFRSKFRGNFKPAIRAANEIYEGIVKYAVSKRAGLIAIGVHRRKGPSRYFTDRITENVIRHTNLPVLAIDNPK